LWDGGHLPGFGFLPDWRAKYPLPAVIVGTGVCGQLIPQYHNHCQHIANRGFVVVLIDPSNYPEALAPDPMHWDKGLGYAKGSVNQIVVATRLFFGYEWYLKTISATVDFLCSWQLVDPTRIAFSGHSQPANAALTYAGRDPRIRAIVWNYGGSPWIMPYDPMRLPPVQIFHGTEDEVYDVKYAMQLAMKLKSYMRPCDVNIYPGQKHLFNVYYDPSRGESRLSRPVLLDAFERLISFLNQALAVPFR
ncbi:MAG: dienelactone hydrolase family protein, partial [Deltaproteobacteria bacterium]|nr:dienelactone hydrolase family protein [Deltaproteobacteria bacterium]